MMILSLTVLVAATLSSTTALKKIDSGSSTGLACPPTHFGCKNAYRCTKKEAMCNGVDDCGDNSDEDLSACILKGNVSAQLNCAMNEFQCKNGFRCVPVEHMCDDDNDCKDQSDEDPNECIKAGIYEDHVTCADIGFVCGEGRGACISRKLLCNGKNDCRDNSDEDLKNCRAESVVEEELSCKDHEFRCKNEFKCIHKLHLCDHENNCFDGSDEDPVECAKEGFVPVGTTCAELGFECKNTTFDRSFCIGNLFICDGKNHCGDNSDENPEICEQRSAKPKLEILPWFQPPELNSTVVRYCGNDYFRCGLGCISNKHFCHPNLICDGEIERDTLVCANHSGIPRCMTHMFQCTNKKCINEGKVCDGIDDCGDMSDEDPISCNSATPRRMATTTIPESSFTRKRPIACKRDYFKCLDESRCIRNSWVCDRESECPDGSDEADEVCTAMLATTLRPPARRDSCEIGQFQCNNKRCILSSHVCDGDDDCKDFSDESPSSCNRSSIKTVKPQASKGEASCQANQFMCTDQKTCIPIANVCDKSRNCDDESDEDPVVCLNSSSQPPPAYSEQENSTIDLHVQLICISFATTALFIFVVVVFIAIKQYKSNPRIRRRF